MKGRFVILLVIALLFFYLDFANKRKILVYTQTIDQIEKSINATKNINTELMVEYDDLCSPDNISNLVSVELQQSELAKGKVVYVQEPNEKTETSSYCIVDLISTKAEASQVQIIPD
ncbi:MAG TPA: hypothetical protein PL126_02750 [Candidatus Cloacimonadota bacterium]|mgnify:CR=1 FL=1|nr:hypothetical protein [Candidatus Cloacimonadota bacterium]